MEEASLIPEGRCAAGFFAADADAVPLYRWVLHPRLDLRPDDLGDRAKAVADYWHASDAAGEIEAMARLGASELLSVVCADHMPAVVDPIGSDFAAVTREVARS